MYTSIGVIAVAGFLVIPIPQQPQRWHLDYGQARNLGKQQSKPLAVIIGSGKTGYQKLCTNGKLSPAVQSLLRTQYVMVYLDTATTNGQRLAAAFEITAGSGIVLSDRSGDRQAFSHNGAMSNANLQQYLTHFSKSNQVAEETISVNHAPAVANVAQRTSYYRYANAYQTPTTTYSPQSAYSQPSYQSPIPSYSGGFGGFGGYGGFAGGGGGC